ncbi:MAG TPA: fibronectin type III domain-containing protein [Solirubrobacteraceae bacterium]|nr:fibronectin type III domain-containing protein [Solirubrobacteraceae bacterium]
MAFAAPQPVEAQGRTFTTVGTPPVLAGAGTSQVGQSSELVTATLQPQGLPTRWELQLATSPAALAQQAAGNTAGTETENIAIGLEQLQPNTTYYYRLTAENPDGVTATGVLTLTTNPAPPVTETFATPLQSPSPDGPAQYLPPRNPQQRTGHTHAHQGAKARQSPTRLPQTQKQRQTPNLRTTGPPRIRHTQKTRLACPRRGTARRP